MNKKRALLNHRGSILQIVLVTMMTLTIFIVSISTIVVNNYQKITLSKDNNTTRLIEVLTIAKIKDEVINSIPFSDQCNYDNYSVKYDVKDDVDYYEFICEIDYKKSNYSFQFKMNKDATYIYDFEYL